MEIFTIVTKLGVRDECADAFTFQEHKLLLKGKGDFIGWTVTSDEDVIDNVYTLSVEISLRVSDWVNCTYNR